MCCRADWCSDIFNDIIDYLREFLLFVSCLFWNQEKRTVIDDAVAASDIVLFTRPSCAYCQAAESELLAIGIAPRNSAGHSDEKRIELGSGPSMSVVQVERSDTFLHMALVQAAADSEMGIVCTGRSHVVSYPWLFVKGRHINNIYGGYEALSTILAEGRLPELLEAPAIPHSKESYPPGQPWWQPAPGGLGPGGYLLQTRIFPNVLRTYAFLQALLTGACLITGTYPTALLWFACIDILLFLLCGPVPAPLGTLATYLAWNARGPHSTILPYKILFGVFYAVGLFAVLLNGDSKEASAAGLFGNSVLLALARF